MFDKDETAETVSIREAKEEAGCDILNLEHICDFFVSPGGSNEFFNLYCGKIQVSFTEGVFGLPHEHEDIRAVTLPFEDALTMLSKGEIITSPAIISLLWLKLNRERLRQLWQIK